MYMKIMTNNIIMTQINTDMTDLSDLKHKIKQLNLIKLIKPLKPINTHLIIINMYCI